MDRTRTRIAAWLVTAGLLALAASPAAAQIRTFRSGTVALGAGGSYGLVTGEGRYGFDFESGGGYNIELKYTVSPRLALGINFANHSYDWVETDCFEDVDDADCPRYRNLVMTTFEGTAFYYFNRRSDAPQYAVFGLGLYRPELRRSDTDTVFPTEGLMLSAGLGVELFLRENWALDLSARAVGYFGDGIADQEAFVVRPGSDLSIGLRAEAGILYFLIK